MHGRYCNFMNFYCPIEFLETPNLFPCLRLFLSVYLLFYMERNLWEIKFIKHAFQSIMREHRKTTLAIFSVEHWCANKISFEDAIYNFAEIKL